MRSNEKTVKKASPRQPARPMSHSGGLVSMEDHILHLQRTAGNEAVAGLIAESAVLQRAPGAAAAPVAPNRADESGDAQLGEGWTPGARPAPGNCRGA